MTNYWFGSLKTTKKKPLKPILAISKSGPLSTVFVTVQHRETYPIKGCPDSARKLRSDQPLTAAYDDIAGF